MARNPAQNPPASATTHTPKSKSLKLYTCKTCNKSFATPKARKSHWSATNHYPVCCSVCNKGFDGDEAVAQHAGVHSGPVAKHATGPEQGGPRSNARRTNPVSAELIGQTVESNLANLTAVLSLQAPVAIVDTGITDSNRLNADSDAPHHVVQTPERQSLHQANTFVYKSNVYSMLALHEQDAIYAALLASCHTPERLRAEQYIMRGQNKSKNKSKNKITHITIFEFRETPRSSVSLAVPGGQTKRKAVAIDCEMVSLVTGGECVAFLSAVDVLTGEILLNTYVNPGIRVRSWRTRYSGVTRIDMERAIAQGQALRGWQAARRALWEHIDAETILVGHSLQNDLNVLGMFHSKIVDSAILSAQAVFPDMLFQSFPRKWGLKMLASYFLGSVIQTGKGGHNCLEDTLATRELVLWCLRSPENLAEWGAVSRLEYERRLVEIRIAKEKKRAEEEEKRKKQSEESAEQDE